MGREKGILAFMTDTVAKFFRDRGPHVAAMIAYFALLSLVPLVFLALALFGLAGRVDESSYLVTELQSMFPTRSFEQIVTVVNGIQDNATALGLVGGPLLAWSSLSLFSVLESAFNIVYGRPNRSFLHGKLVAILLLIASLVVLFVGLVVGTFGFELLTRYAGGVVANDYVAYVLSVVVSSVAVLVFVVAIYYLLTNVNLTVREVLPGALLATVVLQASFQVLPLYLRATSDLVALQAFGGLPILLVWLYVMANVIVFGAEVNWWLTYGRHEGTSEGAEEAPGLA
ncbi:MAG: YihY/virulence factor BrkB family protein [Gaiellaceae bacterium]